MTTDKGSDLSRFIEAQGFYYDMAYEELRKGKKKTHWIWFIFPQLDGLGTSATSIKYAIKSKQEAISYLADPVLGERLRLCCEALLELKDKDINEVMGYPDDLKLQSSMTLFNSISGDCDIFKKVINRYYSGVIDINTVKLMNEMAH